MTNRAQERAHAARRVPSDRAPDRTYAAFADLVCMDPALLRIEFDAIIAANYPRGSGDLDPRPPRRRVPAATGHRASPPRARAPATHDPDPAGSVAASRHAPARQRGPPAEPGPVTETQPIPTEEVVHRLNNQGGIQRQSA